ncbi:MAG TPA: hypothetical protein VFC78_18550 [Tepidisphaeraceae bacterium]|nr:hypothetical protein [Tepidisphaeraceae bacterium]
MSTPTYTLERADKTKPFTLFRAGKAVAQVTGDVGELATIIAALNGTGTSTAERLSAIELAGAAVGAAISHAAENQHVADEAGQPAAELLGL